MEPHTKFFEEANKSFRRADHMLYITYPIIKDKRLVVKIFEDIYESMKGMVNGILQYEYAFKRIQLYQDASMNLEVFRRVAPRFGITNEQVNLLMEVFGIMKQHKESAMEFMKKEKFVIMTQNMHVESISVDKLKSYLFAVKDIFQKVNSKVSLK